MNLTSETLEQMLINMSNAIEAIDKRIAMRPIYMYVPRKLLRQALFISRSNYKSHLMPFKQRNATRRAKARMHASFITPRWAA